MDNLKRPWLKAYDAHVPASLTYPDITLNQLFQRAVKNHPLRPFLHYEDVAFSYSQINQYAAKVSRFLIDKGLKKGDRVALVLPNIPQFVIGYFAVLMAGGIVVAMNPRYTQNEYARLIEQAKVRFFICLDSNFEIMQELRESASLSECIVTAMDEFRTLNDDMVRKRLEIENSQWLGDILNKEPKSSLQEDIAMLPEDAAIFQFSGGTTGYPKPAIGMHKNIVANAIQFSRWCDLEEGHDTILAAIPLYHVYGMVLALNMGIAVGAKIVLISDPTDIENVLSQIQNHKVTFYPGVPTMYHAINQNPKARERVYDLTSIKACISGSFSLHPRIKAAFEEITGGKLIEGYGLSEAPTATHCNPLYGVNKTGSIGLPLPDVDAKIVDIETGRKTLDVGEIGEMIIKGPQVMRGYFMQEEETEQTLRDGWLFTGDIARMDADGYFYLVDRKKSMIKVNGLQVWPTEVEQVVNSHPSVRACAVGGVPDMEHGERVICWVVLEEGETLNADAVREWCREQISGYKIPQEFVGVDQLPRTGVGKILRRELIAGYKKKAGH